MVCLWFPHFKLGLMNRLGFDLEFDSLKMAKEPTNHLLWHGAAAAHRVSLSANGHNSGGGDDMNAETSPPRVRGRSKRNNGIKLSMASSLSPSWSHSPVAIVSWIPSSSSSLAPFPSSSFTPLCRCRRNKPQSQCASLPDSSLSRPACLPHWHSELVSGLESCNPRHMKLRDSTVLSRTAKLC